VGHPVHVHRVSRKVVRAVPQGTPPRDVSVNSSSDQVGKGEVRIKGGDEQGERSVPKRRFNERLDDYRMPRKARKEEKLEQEPRWACLDPLQLEQWGRDKCDKTGWGGGKNQAKRKGENKSRKHRSASPGGKEPVTGTAKTARIQMRNGKEKAAT